MSTGRRFELRRRLGSGSFGEVFLADMVGMGGFRKEVAIKMLRPGLGASSDAGSRLRDEARLLGRLRHRNIVRVDDLIHLDQQWAMVMEYVPGWDLEELMTDVPELAEGLPAGVCCEIGRAVASSLDAAYNASFGGSRPLQLIHRDIKPSNVRVSPEGEVRVLDFGIARADFDERETSTEDVRYGSLPYMSPERLLGDPDAPSGDVYGLGALLAEILTGERVGRPDLREEAHDARRAEVVELIGERHPDLPGLPELVDTCLRYRADARPEAADVEARCKALVARAGGETLETWARRLLEPREHISGEALGDESRVLVEQLTLANRLVGDTESLSGKTRAQSAPTIIPDDLGPPAAQPELAAVPSGQASGNAPTVPVPLPEDEEEHASPSLLIPALIGAAVVLLLGVGMLSSGMLGGGSEVATGQAPAEPVTPDGGSDTLVDSTATLSASEPEEPTPSGEDEAVEDAPDEVVADTKSQASPASAPSRPTPPPAAEAASASARAASTDPASTESVASGSGASETPAAGDASTSSEATESASSAVDAPVSSGTSTETLRAVKFAVAAASSVSASCSGVSATGSTSALLRNVPTGSCTVSATVDGQQLTARVDVDRPRGFECAVDQGALQCR